MAKGNTKGTAVGAVIGGLAGLAYGCHVADQKATYAKIEADLRASSQRATALANASRAESQRLGEQVAALTQQVQALRTAQINAQARQVAMQNRQRQVIALQAEVDQRLRAVREEIARQTAAAQAAEAEARRVAAAPAAQPASVPAEGMRLVAAGIRHLDQQGRTLESVKAQLQQIDRRRAY